jgi:hypothetical protein
MRIVVQSGRSDLNLRNYLNLRNDRNLRNDAQIGIRTQVDEKATKKKHFPAKVSQINKLRQKAT